MLYSSFCSSSMGTATEVDDINSLPSSIKISLGQPYEEYKRAIFQNILTQISSDVGILAPKCFISYACGYDEKKMSIEQKNHRRFVNRFVDDLSTAGIITIYDLNPDGLVRQRLPISGNIDTFLDEILKPSTQNVLLLLSKYFKTQCETDRNSGAAKELKRIQERITVRGGSASFLTTILLDGSPEECIPIGSGFVHIIFLKSNSTDEIQYYELFFTILSEKVLSHLSSPRSSGEPFINMEAYRRSFQDQLTLHPTSVQFALSELDRTSATKIAEDFVSVKSEKCSSQDIQVIHNIPRTYKLTAFIESKIKDSSESYLNRVENELTDHRRLTITSSVVACTLSGMGGIGKTHLAFAYSDRYKDRYSVVYWLYSETEESLFNSYRKLLEALDVGIQIHESKELIIKLVERVLSKKTRETGKPWLLVYDNLLAPGNSNIAIPDGGHILITSRQNSGWEHSQINLDVFQPEDSINLLFTKTKKTRTVENVYAAYQIAEALGHLPLALSHAASFIEQKKITFETYLARLHSKTEEIIAYKPTTAAYPYSVANTWSITMASLSPKANILMSYFSFLNSENIPIKPFESISDFESAIEELIQYSMIKKDETEEIISIHRLVQLVTRQNLFKTGQSKVVMQNLLQQWECFWGGQNQTYGTGILGTYAIGLFETITSFIFKDKEHLAEISQINKLSYDLFYPHMDHMTKCITELTESGIDCVDLVRSTEKLKSIVEEVMDITQPILLSGYTKTEELSIVTHKKQNDGLIRVLSQGLDSCFHEECKLLLEVAGPLLPMGISGTDCLTIVRALRSSYFPRHFELNEKLNMQEIVETILMLEGNKISIPDCASFISAFHAIPYGQRKEVAEAFLALNKEGLSVSEKCELIKDFSSVGVGRQTVIAHEVNKITANIKRNGQIILDQHSSDLMRYLKLMYEQIRNISDVIKLAGTIDSLKLNKEQLFNIMDRHQDITNIKIKLFFLQNLSSVKDTTEIDSIIHCTHLLLLGNSYHSEADMQKILNAVDIAQYREEICQEIQSNYPKLYISEKSEVIKILAQKDLTEIREIFAYTKRFCDTNTYSIRGYLETIISIPAQERNSIIQAIMSVTRGGNISYAQLRSLIDVFLSATPEKREDISLLANLREGLLDKKDRHSLSIPKLSREQMGVMAEKYDPQVVMLSNLFVHEGMTKYEALLIYEEINKIIPQKRAEFITKVQQLVKDKKSLDASVYLKIFGIIGRISESKWVSFVSKMSVKGIHRLNLHDIEMELEN